jgi:hypothetical protein
MQREDVNTRGGEGSLDGIDKKERGREDVNRERKTYVRALPGKELTLLRCTPAAITMDSTLDETIRASTPGIYTHHTRRLFLNIAKYYFWYLTHHALYLL